jgi:hypothetical protein
MIHLNCCSAFVHGFLLHSSPSLIVPEASYSVLSVAWCLGAPDTTAYFLD